jgi:2-amino-4-hydroxy-6-hydroxymethyldihydropteridine diphosphokinase
LEILAGGAMVNPDDTVVIALGGNLAGGFPSSESLLGAAVAAFAQAGLPVVRRSGWWRSAAWPDPSAPEYRNAVALVEAHVGPGETLRRLLSLEERFGRERGAANAPRTLDLDLVAHGRAVVNRRGLVVPHPRAQERLFVMGPLAEIAPGWRHPVLGLTAADLAAAATVGCDARPV